MYFSHISIGGGIIGVETIISIVSSLKQNLKKNKRNSRKFRFDKFNFAIIDKEPKNIPGGVAYSFQNSQYGYFNNPIRLSPIKFQKWVKAKENKKKILLYLSKFGGFSGKAWIEKNKKILLSHNKFFFDELYLPRVAMNIWMEEKLDKLYQDIRFIRKKYKVFLNLSFFQGEVIKISNSNNIYKELKFRNNYCYKLEINYKKNSLRKYRFDIKKKTKTKMHSITQSISLGLNPPKQLATSKAKKSKNYIWDFYANGSTAELIKKIFLMKKNNKNKKILIYFVGYKAGLLEPLTELRHLVFQKNLNLKAICSSNKLNSIEKAELTENKATYKLKYLKNNNLSHIRTAKKLYTFLIKEFLYASSINYQKYDAWTEILKKK